VGGGSVVVVGGELVRTSFLSKRFLSKRFLTADGRHEFFVVLGVE
jgi:hypothetical protein